LGLRGELSYEGNEEPGSSELFVVGTLILRVNGSSFDSSFFNHQLGPRRVDIGGGGCGTSESINTFSDDVEVGSIEGMVKSTEPLEPLVALSKISGIIRSV
jgi:hypothetical protein